LESDEIVPGDNDHCGTGVTGFDSKGEGTNRAGSPLVSCTSESPMLKGSFGQNVIRRGVRASSTTGAKPKPLSDLAAANKPEAMLMMRAFLETT
jgi:hypothetical protein